jgi:hypothetical protein
MDLDTLARFDWISPSRPAVRMVFRRDGTGFYERDAGPGLRAVRENLLHRSEGARLLRLKFARARGWIELEAELRAGAAEPGARLAQHLLFLAEDPYAATLGERLTGPLTLESDAGAALDD